MQMTLSTFIKELAAVVQQAKLERALSMSKGNLPDMETYHRNVGRLEGLDQAVAMARDMHNTLRDRDNDSDLPEMTGND